MCSFKFFDRKVENNYYELIFLDMTELSLSNDKASLCYKNNCINFKGDLAKAITFSIALVVVVSGVASLFETSK